MNSKTSALVPPPFQSPGDVREDGMVFSHYRNFNMFKPVWITKAQWEALPKYKKNRRVI